jgi:thiol-disulfide isomerase/thioredoxin
MALLTRRSQLIFGGVALAGGAATLIAALSARKPPVVETIGGEPMAMRPVSDIERVSPPAAMPEAACLALDGSGKQVPGDWRGRIVVLNFWATWCIPCVAELPALDRLAQAEPAFAVLAVSADRAGAEVVRPFLASHDIAHLDTLLDPHGEAGRLFGVNGFPTTLILNTAGRLCGRLEGPANWAAAASTIRGLAG